MNSKAILHIPESPFACYLGNGRFLLRLRVDKGDRDVNAYVHYGAKYPFTEKRDIAAMRISYEDGDFAYLDAIVELNDRRLAYVFELREGEKRQFYSEKGLIGGYDFKVSYRDFFQFPYVYEQMSTPGWVKGAVFYQIFPDRLKMGDKGKDKGYINLKWGDKPKPTSFAGGDLKGIIESIPYLNELGVNAIYLTPIFLSKSYHKYDTFDYMRIDPQLGDEKDLINLIHAAHKSGIRIMLDAVFNHVSKESIYFKDAIANGKDSYYWDWFFVKGDSIDVDEPNYEYFSVCPYMPKLNGDCPSCYEYLLGVCLHYLKLGIDGWRLDVADEVSHRFWKRLSEDIKLRYPESILVAEHWHNPNRFLEDGIDGAMNYPITYAVEDYIAKKEIDAAGAASRINRIYANLYPSKIDGMLNLLESHDTFRFLTLCGGDVDRYRQALALLFFLPGMSCIYYGTEIPMEGGYDPDSRRCFPQEGFERQSDQFRFLQKLISLRKQSPMAGGDFSCYEEDGMLVVERTKGGEGLRLMLNATSAPKPCHGEFLLESKKENDELLPSGFIIRRIKR